MSSLKSKNFVFLGLGANLRSLSHSSIKKLLLSSMKRLNYIGLRVQKPFYFLNSSPMPFTSGPNFINCVFKCLIIGNKSSTPAKLYANIVQIEKILGKKKNKINKARFIDIDILDFKGKIINESLILPHPRLHLRKFVLEPLEKVSPSWEHPILKKRIAYLKSKIKTNEIIRKL